MNRNKDRNGIWSTSSFQTEAVLNRMTTEIVDIGQNKRAIFDTQKSVLKFLNGMQVVLEVKACSTTRKYVSLEEIDLNCDTSVTKINQTQELCMINSKHRKLTKEARMMVTLPHVVLSDRKSFDYF
jgi:hypothetical protein